MNSGLLVLDCFASLPAARSRLQGHSKPVEEVVFKPNSTMELASVGDDSQVTRQG